MNLPLAAVASFHGILSTDIPATEPIAPRILVCHGDKDPLVPRAQVAAFEEEMDRAGAEWHLHVYGNARHGFTDPEADSHGIPALAYDASAGRQPRPALSACRWRASSRKRARCGPPACSTASSESSHSTVSCGSTSAAAEGGWVGAANADPVSGSLVEEAARLMCERSVMAVAQGRARFETSTAYYRSARPFESAEKQVRP